jgi:Ca2+-binding EF-hand superfamily protein
MKVGGVAVDEILQRLGAKLEQGTKKDLLDDYTSHFDRTDPNGDGMHTQEEYIEKGRYLTPQARAGIFRAADGNADGVVTKAEYVLNRIITDEAKAIVQGMDDDKDGVVERSEFIKSATILLSDRALAESVFDAMDANDDGGISIPEYLRVWGQWARSGKRPANERIAGRRTEVTEATGRPSQSPGRRVGGFSVERLFRHDRNDDGKVSKAEMPEFLVERIFDRIDANKDDFIDKEEAESFGKRLPANRSSGWQPGDLP